MFFFIGANNDKIIDMIISIAWGFIVGLCSVTGLSGNSAWLVLQFPNPSFIGALDVLQYLNNKTVTILYFREAS